jgi:hypothetical protein
MNGLKTQLYSLSGDWAEIAPGVRVRLQNAPNEEDMQEFYRCPDGIVILEVERERS